MKRKRWFKALVDEPVSIAMGVGGIFEWNRDGESNNRAVTVLTKAKMDPAIKWCLREYEIQRYIDAGEIEEIFNFEPRTTTLPQDSKARKDYALYRGLLRYFPAALAAAARVSKVGNDKHNPGEPMHHAREKSTDQEDCIMRHLIDLEEDFGQGVGRDEQGMPQVGYIVWRALALAQIWLEEHEGAPVAPGAVLKVKEGG